MFYAAYRLDGKEYGKLYCNYDEYYTDTFSPFAEHLTFIPFKVTGKTYQERKESIRNQAVDWSTSYSYSNLSMNELAMITSWFNCNASRYGLINEFHENATC